MFRLLLIILICLTEQSVFSARNYSQKNFKLKYGEISILVPNSWQAVENLYGMPLMILGKEVNGRRPVVSFHSTNITNTKPNENEIRKNITGYHKGRKEWLSKRNGDLIKFLPYTVNKLSPSITLHSIGYKYDLGKNRYTEMTYYIVCKSRFFNLKTLVTSEHNNQHLKLNDIVRSFKCF